MQTMSDRNWATVDQFIKDLNRHRLNSKQEWYAYTGNVCGKQVVIKCHGLWAQQLIVNGIRHGFPYAATVGTWKQAILDAITYESPVVQSGAHN